MANEVNVYDETFKAAQDLRSSQYCFVAMTTSGEVDLANASGEKHIGILQNQPRSGDNAVVRMLGRSKLRGAGTVTAGGLVTTDHVGEGLGVTLTSGEYVVCRTLDAVADGKTGEVLVRGIPVRAQ